MGAATIGTSGTVETIESFGTRCVHAFTFVKSPARYRFIKSFSLSGEWPVVAGVQPDNPVLKALGAFKQDSINVAVLGRNQPGSQKIYDRVAWK